MHAEAGAIEVVGGMERWGLARGERGVDGIPTGGTAINSPSPLQNG